MKQLYTFGKDSLFYLLLVTIFSLFVYSKNLTAQTPGVTPYPNLGAADVNGNISEWNTTIGGDDWFAEMYEGWNQNGKDRITSHLYLRWDKDNGVMYALVLQEANIPIIMLSDDNWIAINNINNKVVKGDSGDNGIAPDFEYYGIGFDGNSEHARGWEASFPLSCGLYQIIAHAEVLYNGGNATSGTEDKTITLNADCSLPVELTTFNVNIYNNFAELNWETATEVNNYGFEIQRSENNENAWEKIGFVNGHGNSNSPKSYSFQDKSLNEAGKYYYRLKQIDVDGSYVYSDVAETSFDAPVEYKLSQNFPNPFNPTTTISFSIPQAGYVSLKVYDMLGNEVAEIFRGNKAAGNYNYQFDASKLASGVYIYKLQAGELISAKRLILLK